MGIQKRQAKGGRYTALACMFGMMICLFLYVSVLMPRFMTIIMLFLASSLLGCLVVEGEFGKAFWVYVATRGHLWDDAVLLVLWLVPDFKICLGRI